MKKLLLSLGLCLGIASVANAQVGRTQVNAGVGFDSWDGIPVYAGVDYFVTDVISVGGEVSYASINDYSGVDMDISIFGIGANGNYHFDQVLTLPEEWNIYAGLNLTYYNWNTDFDGDYKFDDDGLNLGGQVGARYFFSPNFGVNLEFGGGSNVSGGRLGITYKIN